MFPDLQANFAQTSNHFPKIFEAASLLPRHTSTHTAKVKKKLKHYMLQGFFSICFFPTHLRHTHIKAYIIQYLGQKPRLSGCGLNSARRKNKWRRTEMEQKNPKRLLRLNQVLDKVPISRSHWWRGVAAGNYPAPIKLSPRVTAWFESDIDALIDRLGMEAHEVRRA